MKKRRYLLVAVTLTVMAALTACGPSEEKLNEAETARSGLVEAKNKAEETYLDITDSSKRETLDELAKRETAIEEKDFKKLNDKKIDDLLIEINEISEEYSKVQEDLDSTLEAENAERAEAALHRRVPAYITNSTGSAYSKIVLHDLTKDEYSDNLLGEGTSLGAGETLMGVTFVINTESSEWEIVAEKEDGSSVSFSMDSLQGHEETGVSVSLGVDSTSETASATLGNY